MPIGSGYYRSDFGGKLSYSDAVYLVAHNAPDAEVVEDPATTQNASHTLSAGIYYLGRSIPIWGTIPQIGMVILSAEIRLYGASIATHADAISLVAVPSRDTVSPLQASDWSEIDLSTQFGSILLASWVNGGWNTIPLNAAAVAYLNSILAVELPSVLL